MNEQEAKDFIEKHKWTFAKTMANIPHEWLHMKTCDRSEFLAFVKYLDANKYPGKFYSRTFWYTNIDGYKYWTCSDKVETTDLINRAKLG